MIMELTGQRSFEDVIKVMALRWEVFLGDPCGPNILTWVLKITETFLAVVRSCEDGSWVMPHGCLWRWRTIFPSCSQVLRNSWATRSRKSWETHSSLEPIGGMLPCPHLNFSPTCQTHKRINVSLYNQVCGNFKLRRFPQIYQIFKKGITPNLHNPFQETEGERTCLNSFYKVRITMTPKLVEDIMWKGNYRPIPLINTDTRILNEILVNWIQGYINDLDNTSWPREVWIRKPKTL